MARQREAPILVSDPAPDVLATGLKDNAVAMTVRVWFPSSMLSEEPAINSAIRATHGTLETAGIQLATPDVTLRKPTD